LSLAETFSDRSNAPLDLIPLFGPARRGQIRIDRRAGVRRNGDTVMATLPLRANAAPNAGGALPLAGRVGIAAIFILSGLSKLAAPAAAIGYIQSVGLPLPQLGLAIAVLVELVGGVALVLGYRTRLVAGALAAFSIVAAIFFHAALGDQNQFIHFFKNVAIAGGLLNVMALGGGAWSLDARR
jgi:putative oxidoreductase